MKVGNRAFSQLRSFWLRLDSQTTERSWFVPQNTVILCTDACAHGWGAWFKDQHGLRCYQRTWHSSSVAAAHNNYLELRAVREALMESDLASVFIRVFSDNTATVHMLNSMYSRVPDHAEEVMLILTWLL